MTITRYDRLWTDEMLCSSFSSLHSEFFVSDIAVHLPQSGQTDQSVLKWNARLRTGSDCPEFPCSWIRTAQFSSSGQTQQRNLDSCTHAHGPRSNFEIMGGGTISDSMLGGHKTLFLTKSL